MKRKTIQQLVQEWNALQNDEEMVDFIDGMTQTETKLLEMAIRAGITTQEPGYMLKESA
ncbi:hypothetical protein UFOVP646_24 [uncultured Caudovirales phage]|uniref:Uncharacterized protein n=1 Tax=uncultured Caudovirales phage TaxID=2100421 RepID=A0A6J5LR08_9CAUD|nr:hypothetical protein UFOVP284_32 [uncultured Caudovirales phage]CAB4154689.1 hypothetical protein UFOVP646_24 [uncultured Caudovirales phage]